MGEEFREELLSISEKLGKYSSSMQESLNILSDEFLLLRDELSTLNQNLDTTKNLDEKLEKFSRSVEVLSGIQEKLKVVEKVADSLAVADSLSARIDLLAQKIDGNKDKMTEVVSPLNKKMDLLFSKFDETLAPVGKKVDVLSEAFKEELKESTDTLKGEEQLKGLAMSIQDELNKLQKSFEEQNNAIRGVSTSVAYLSSNEGEFKKSLDGLIKIYEQDREKDAAERTKAETEGKRHGSEGKSEKLDEIIAMLKVQMEQLQKHEIILEGMKAPKQAVAAPSEELLREIKKQADNFAKLQQDLTQQTKMLALFKDSMPTGNFEEVIKHADLINQSTNTKLDSLMEMNAAYAKSISANGERAAQLPGLMQNVSAALDALVQEMKKSQQAYRSLEDVIQKMPQKPAEPAPAHMEKLEVITENIRGLHTKIDNTQPIEAQLRLVIEELKHFEEMEQQRLAEKPAAPMPDFEQKLNLVIEELKKFEVMEQQRLQKSPATAATSIAEDSSRLEPQLISIKKELSNVSSNVTELKNVLTQGADITAEVDFRPLLAKIDEVQTQIQMFAQSAPTQQPTPQLSGAKLLDQREILEEIQQNIRVFQSFELSDRAKIVVDRIEMLVKRGLSLYSS